MKVHQPLAVISLIALITTFATTSFAEDDITAKAEKFTGQTLQSHVPSCGLTITNPNNFLYLDRSQQKLKITQVPPGTYSVLELAPGWVKILANNWVGWMQVDTVGVTGSVIQKRPQLRVASKTASCPTRN